MPAGVVVMVSGVAVIVVMREHVVLWIPAICFAVVGVVAMLDVVELVTVFIAAFT